MAAAARALGRPGAADAVAELVLAARRAPAAAGPARRSTRLRRGAPRDRRPGDAAAGRRSTRSRCRDRRSSAGSGSRPRATSRSARFTTMRVGGPADLFATAHNAFELRALVRFARVARHPHALLGRGSDVVIADAGRPRPGRPVRAEGRASTASAYVAESGVPMARAATETQQAGLTGLEFGLAIPGTVGGAVWANAGAHDSRRRRRSSSRPTCCSPTAPRRACRRPSSAWAIATAGSSTADRRHRRDRPRRDVPARAGRPGRDQGPPRRHPALAPGASAARASRRAGLVLPQPARRPSAGRLIEAAGLKGTRPAARRVSREARQLHRQRPQGHRGGRPRGSVDQVRGRGRSASPASDLEPEVVFVGDWAGWPWRAGRDRPRRRSDGRADDRRLPADRRPPRRAVRRARRVDRLGHRHRRGACASRGHASRQVLIDLDGGWWWLPRRPSPRTDGPAAYDDPAALGATGR